MPDRGDKYAEKKIASVDKQLEKIYGQAEKELKKKLADFVKRSKQRERLKRMQLDAGQITQEEFDDWYKGQLFQKERWEQQIKSIQQTLYDHNQQAAKIVHENKLDVFGENYLAEAFKCECITGIRFDLYNTQSVARMISEHPQLLPEWEIDKEKDYKWNYNKVNNSIIQGIIQGESVEDIANRLTTNLCTQNKNKMRMFARTAITGAENAGRQVQMEQAEKMGIEVHKRWYATLDSRTRDAHRHLDGDEVPQSEKFHSDLGDIRCPGDPEAVPANVYNCRCTMVSIYPKYEQQQKNWREDETIDGVPYEVWKQGKKGNEIKSEIDVIENYTKAEKRDVDKEIDVILDKKTEKLINSASQRITKDFPNIDKYIKRIVFGNVGKNNPAQFISHEDKKTHVVGNIIALNYDMWRDIKAIKQLVKEESESGRHIKTRNPKAIIAHEYGHGIYRSCIMKLSGYNGSGAITSDNIDKMAQMALFINDSVERIRDNAKDSYISKRGKKDLSEYIAEAFSDYYYGSHPKKVSKDIVNFFKGVFN